MRHLFRLVEHDQVDIAGIVQLARAELAHAKRENSAIGCRLSGVGQCEAAAAVLLPQKEGECCLYTAVGAFGDDHEDRNQLLPIVLERFRKMMGLELDYRDCVVIGDTPMDVACAKPYGATAIAVSTGSYDYESLLETGADYVLKDLSTALDDLDIFNLQSR